MLLWKLLKKNLSIPQLLGYVISGWVGLSIIFFALQFYLDTRPIFSSHDSFFNPDFLVVNKQVSALSNLSLASSLFNEREIEDIKKQPFVGQVGEFTSSKFGVDASLSSESFGGYRTQMFFESVPDNFIDVESKQWSWSDGQTLIPIIIPRSYLSLYNFGFAQSQGLPQISENIVESVKLDVLIYGNSKRQAFDAKIVGFSDKLNTILVPQLFMEWANGEFGNAKGEGTSRLLVETKNPGDPLIAEYFAKKKYQIADDKGAAGKAAYFARIITISVLIVGFIITLLAVSLMLLSVSLLIYKNKEKIENLMLLGYLRRKVAKHYQVLGFVLTFIIFILAFISALVLRNLYLKQLSVLVDKDNFQSNTLIIFGFGFIVLLLICAINSIWIRAKVNETFK